ncbi:acyl-homoserine-lactone synthase [Ketogulonicigenium vulgare]|uniref:acyl-homoserine-lactone synthase n=1 Tax=Ketogulonicigenium vulgare (strain WSH-001) TaxID=759362 RepID=F9Y5A9_KETVW|nr:acyl-homoserine-lactone synthase [Ketogulonicigenium vulgare]ADO43646.1 N-acyl-L-homoserine lactone synthetase-like protein [Ketogulonicigenium vulgare Y25]AEM41914.1 N-acyl-L-homoserine lactone synthetase-like protein [Ketogulonicigenium vulgare WSH-001]ALJ82017.1 N-acyl-L-homoserine lactone synthetase [Ketogulonicigenium vulgare]ANW34651.1 N-acyl-L-homoserine lactone synthetase [Ketogulonicigenium vulgare]AOZ55678.1 N-acyl-L-homoserine lactone synthetase-like protein [Ketogulonicigenium v
MQSTTLSFANLHNHGELFVNILRARRESFIIRRQWDLPEAMGMEFDQYDTPASRWVAVHDDTGRVMAGVRLTPSTAQCGIYTYMIHDAQRGLLETIPTDLLYETAPIETGVWEVSRGFVSNDLPAGLRARARVQLVQQMMTAARSEGISKMVALLPSNWNRWAARCGLKMSAAGRNMNMGGIDYQAVWIDFADNLH